MKILPWIFAATDLWREESSSQAKGIDLLSILLSLGKMFWFLACTTYASKDNF